MRRATLTVIYELKMVNRTLVMVAAPVWTPDEFCSGKKPPNLPVS